MVSQSRQEQGGERSNTTLKGPNNLALLAIIAANLALYFVLLYGDAFRSLKFDEVFHHLPILLPSTTLVVAIAILNAILTADAKAKFVFLRRTDPLPGSRAFSHFAKTDSRINIDKLREKLGSFPKAPHRQNAVWYSLYKGMEDDPSIRQLHKYYLLFRDYAVFAVLLAVVLGALSFKQFSSLTMALSYTGFLIVQVVLVVRAARVYAYRFVTTVLARKSAEP